MPHRSGISDDLIGVFSSSRADDVDDSRGFFLSTRRSPVSRQINKDQRPDLMYAVTSSNNVHDLPLRYAMLSIDASSTEMKAPRETHRAEYI